MYELSRYTTAVSAAVKLVTPVATDEQGCTVSMVVPISPVNSNRSNCESAVEVGPPEQYCACACIPTRARIATSRVFLIMFLISVFVNV